MDSTQADKIARLVAARLNHDYISPITAIANSLEIYAMDVSQQDEAIDIIRESVSLATNQLQYNRIAFGTCGDTETIAPNDVLERMNAYFEPSKTKISLPPHSEPPMRCDIKLWFLVILCLQSSFVRIEEISVEAVKEGWKIVAKGKGGEDRDDEPRAEEHWLQLAAPEPSTVHFQLMFMLLGYLNYDIVRQRGDDSFTVNLWKKAF